MPTVQTDRHLTFAILQPRCRNNVCLQIWIRGEYIFPPSNILFYSPAWKLECMLQPLSECVLPFTILIQHKEVIFRPCVSAETASSCNKKKVDSNARCLI